VFATDTLGFSPEWFSRIGGELYLAGLNSTIVPLPELATDAKADPKAIEQMKQCATEMIGAVGERPMEVKRAALVCITTVCIFAELNTDLHCSVSVL
jgi:hypothetical protein